MRLLDRILSEGVKYLPQLNMQNTIKALENSQLIVIDNVARYHFQELPKKLEESSSELKATDFPNVMLPFETAFFEMRIPQNLDITSLNEVGVLTEMYKTEGKSLEDVLIDVPTDSEEYNRARLVILNEQVVYHLFCTLFVYGRDLRDVNLLASFIVPVNGQGQIVSIDNVFPFVGKVLVDLPGFKDKEDSTVFYLATTFLFPCLLALSFMHCRNVKIVEEIPPPKLSKKWQKKTERPLLKYRVLQIDHMKAILEREGKASPQGLKHALHICRGHFKTYGKDGKGLLFGKYEATVWIPMHTRGSMEEGVVVKDYEVVG